MKLKITVQGVTYEVDVEIVGEGEYIGAAPVVMAPQIRQQPTVSESLPKPMVKSVAKPSANILASPVAGTVIELKCKAGDSVKRGQPLLLIEAMKMETTIASDRDAVVSKVCVASGEAVREGQALIEYASFGE